MYSAHQIDRDTYLVSVNLLLPPNFRNHFLSQQPRFSVHTEQNPIWGASHLHARYCTNSFTVNDKNRQLDGERKISGCPRRWGTGGEKEVTAEGCEVLQNLNFEGWLIGGRHMASESGHGACKARAPSLESHLNPLPLHPYSTSACFFWGCLQMNWNWLWSWNDKATDYSL